MKPKPQPTSNKPTPRGTAQRAAELGRLMQQRVAPKGKALLKGK